MCVLQYDSVCVCAHFCSVSVKALSLFLAWKMNLWGFFIFKAVLISELTASPARTSGQIHRPSGATSVQHRMYQLSIWLLCWSGLGWLQGIAAQFGVRGPSGDRRRDPSALFLGSN